MKRLVVNADDFGADDSRNRGIAAAVAAGAVTAVSVLVNGPAFAEGLPCLHDWQRRGISIGLHLNLSEGRPLAKDLRILVGEDACFPDKGATQTLLMQRGNQELEREIVRETEAQIKALQIKGITIGHLDGHQHVHIFPAAVAAVVEAAARHGISRLRIPEETPPGSNPVFTHGQNCDHYSLTRDVHRSSKHHPPEGGASGKTIKTKHRDHSEAAVPECGPSSPGDTLLREGALFSRLAAAARPLVAAAGVGTTDHFRGLFLKGRMTLPLLKAVLKNLPAGLTELMVHPGAVPHNPGTGPFAAFATADRQRELEVLLAPAFPVLLKRYGITLTSRRESGA